MQYDSALVWFRRDLRVDDHAALYRALRASRRVYCVFVFDREILDALPSKQDRRLDDRACNVEASRKSVRGCQDDAATSAGSVGDADPIITCEHHTESSCPVPVFNQGFPNAGVHGQGITRPGTESLIVGDVRWRGWAISKPQGANGARTVQGDSARGRDIPGAEVSLRIGSIGLDAANPIRRNQPRTSSGDGPHAIRLRAKATRISQGHCCNPEESRRREWEAGGFHIISAGTT